MNNSNNNFFSNENNTNNLNFSNLNPEINSQPNDVMTQMVQQSVVQPVTPNMNEMQPQVSSVMPEVSQSMNPVTQMMQQNVAQPVTPNMNEMQPQVSSVMPEVSQSMNPVTQMMQQNVAQPITPNMNEMQPQVSGVMPEVSQSMNSVTQMMQQNVAQPVTQMMQQNVAQPVTPNMNEMQPQVSVSMPEVSQSMNQNINSFSSMQGANDDELLKAFIGKNYEKITTKAFNFAGFFFSTFYMFYRKMFLYGLILFLINLVVLNLINNYIVTFAFNLVIGFVVNKIYIFYAKNKINKIKFNNSQKTKYELVSICESQGGTSVGKIFLGFIVELLITILIVIIMVMVGITSFFTSLISDFVGFGTKIDSNGNAVFDGGFLYNSSVVIKDEFSIKIPDDFEEGMFNDENHIDYEKKYEEDYSRYELCSISFAQIEGYSSAENLATQMHDYFSDTNLTNISKTKINNVNWYLFSSEGYGTTTYYYLTEKKNKVFLFEYNIDDDDFTGCLEQKDKIINSIKSK